MGFDPSWGQGTGSQGTGGPTATTGAPAPAPTAAPRTPTVPGVSPEGAPGAQGVYGPPATNPWWPAAVVSLVLPGIGLLLLTDQDRRRHAFAILGVYLAGHLALSVLVLAFATLVPLLGTLFWIAQVFFTLLLHVGSMVYTHDEQVRAQPGLGVPIVFRKPLPLPPKLG